MSTCSDCFTGCSEIVSDKCIKYTGIDVPLLGIQTGDSLSYIEQTLIGFLTSTLDGTGIKIDVPSDTYCQPTACTLVSNYLPTCKDISAVDLFVALIRAACDLQTQVDVIDETLLTLNADYTLPTNCFPIGVVPSAGTHDILQAVIGVLCSVKVDLAALTLNLSTNYASIGTELNAQIQNYLTTIAPTTNKMYLKMVPYVAVPYYGPISGYPSGTDFFDGSGAGHGVWEQVYLCNGDNNTPDMRGRVAVGVTNMFGVVPLDPAVVSPIYIVNTAMGSNSVVLSPSEMPVHSHTATSVPTVSPHSHFTVGTVLSGEVPLSATNSIRTEHTGAGDESYILQGVALTPTTGLTNTVTVGVTVATTVANSTPGGGAHNNIQPSIGSYYIIFIPI